MTRCACRTREGVWSELDSPTLPRLPPTPPDMSGWTFWPQNVQLSKSGLAWPGPITFSPLGIWIKTHVEKLTSGVKGGHDFWVRIRATQTVCARTISGLWLNSVICWMNEHMEAKWWGKRRVSRAGRPIQAVTVRTDLWGYAGTPRKTSPLVAWLPSSPIFSQNGAFVLCNQRA